MENDQRRTSSSTTDTFHKDVNIFLLGQSSKMPHILRDGCFFFKCILVFSQKSQKRPHIIRREVTSDCSYIARIWRRGLVTRIPCYQNLLAAHAMIMRCRKNKIILAKYPTTVLGIGVMREWLQLNGHDKNIHGRAYMYCRTIGKALILKQTHPWHQR